MGASHSPRQTQHGNVSLLSPFPVTHLLSSTFLGYWMHFYFLLGPTLLDEMFACRVVDTVNPLKPDIHLTNIYKFNPYLTANALHPYYKDQPDNSV
jgi:hypothetical protein